MAKFKTAAPTHIDAATGNTPTQQEADNLADQLESPAAAIEGEQGDSIGPGLQGDDIALVGVYEGDADGNPIAEPAAPAAEETASVGEGEQSTEQVEQVEQPEESPVIAYLNRLRAAEHEVEIAKRVWKSAKAEVKAAKEDYEEKLAELQSLVQCSSDYCGGKSQKSLEAPRASDSPAGEATTDQITTTTTPLADPDTWKSVLISKLDISEKLVEKLNEANVYDLGQLANFREQIALGREKWPKGIGEAKITAIEDAMTEWLTQNRDAGIFSQGGGVVAEPSSALTDSHGDDITLPAEPTEVKLPAVKEEVTKPNEDWAAMDSVERAGFVLSLSIELCDGKTASQLEAAKETEGRYFEWGMTAQGNGEPVISAIDLPPSPAQNDWIRGWYCGSIVSEVQDEFLANDEPTDIINEAEADLEPAATSSSQFSTTTVLADIDDV